MQLAQKQMSEQAHVPRDPCYTPRTPLDHVGRKRRGCFPPHMSSREGSSGKLYFQGMSVLTLPELCHRGWSWQRRCFANGSRQGWAGWTITLKLPSERVKLPGTRRKLWSRGRAPRNKHPPPVSLHLLLHPTGLISLIILSLRHSQNPYYQRKLQPLCTGWFFWTTKKFI